MLQLLHANFNSGLYSNEEPRRLDCDLDIARGGSFPNLDEEEADHERVKQCRSLNSGTLVGRKGFGSMILPRGRQRRIHQQGQFASQSVFDADRLNPMVSRSRPVRSQMISRELPRTFFEKARKNIPLPTQMVDGTRAYITRHAGLGSLIKL